MENVLDFQHKIECKVICIYIYQRKCYISLQKPYKGLIPRQRNTSRETVYAKYGWLHMNNSIEFSLREQKFRFASE